MARATPCYIKWLVLLAAALAQAQAERQTNQKQPMWSPDGKYYAGLEEREAVTNVAIYEFDRQQRSSSHAQTIAAANLDSADERLNLLAAENKSIGVTFFDWAHDSEHYVFLLYSPAVVDLFVGRLGSEQTWRLTKDAEMENTPRWSPDDRYLVYVKAGDLYFLEFDWQAMQVKAQGRLTHDPETPELYPEWNPQSPTYELAFSRRAGGTPPYSYNVAVYRSDRPELPVETTPADTAALSYVTLDNAMNELHPTYSPDGEKLAFYGITGEGTKYYIYTTASSMGLTDEQSAGETAMKQLSPLPVVPSIFMGPSWSCDGRKIAFVEDMLAYYPIRIGEAEAPVDSLKKNAGEGQPYFQNSDVAWSPNSYDLAFSSRNLKTSLNDLRIEDVADIAPPGFAAENFSRVYPVTLHVPPIADSLFAPAKLRLEAFRLFNANGVPIKISEKDFAGLDNGGYRFNLRRKPGPRLKAQVRLFGWRGETEFALGAPRVDIALKPAPITYQISFYDKQTLLPAEETQPKVEIYNSKYARRIPALKRENDETFGFAAERSDYVVIACSSRTYFPRLRAILQDGRPLPEKRLEKFLRETARFRRENREEARLKSSLGVSFDLQLFGENAGARIAALLVPKGRIHFVVANRKGQLLSDFAVKCNIESFDGLWPKGQRIFIWEREGTIALDLTFEKKGLGKHRVKDVVMTSACKVLKIFLGAPSRHELVDCPASAPAKPPPVVAISANPTPKQAEKRQEPALPPSASGAATKNEDQKPNQAAAASPTTFQTDSLMIRVVNTRDVPIAGVDVEVKLIAGTGRVRTLVTPPQNTNRTGRAHFALPPDFASAPSVRIEISVSRSGQAWHISEPALPVALDKLERRAPNFYFLRVKAFP